MQRLVKRVTAGLLAGVFVLAPVACTDDGAEDEVIEDEELGGEEEDE